MAMIILPRIDDPVPLTFIPDVQFGEADGKPLLLDVIALRDTPAAPRPMESTPTTPGSGAAPQAAT